MSSSSKKILIFGLLSTQFLAFSGTTWANAENFLQTLESGFYSNAIPATTGGIVVPGSGGSIFTQGSVESTSGGTSRNTSTSLPTGGNIISNSTGGSGAPLPGSITNTGNIFEPVTIEIPVKIESTKPLQRKSINRTRKVTASTGYNNSQVQISLNSIDGNNNLSPGMLVTKKSSKDFSNMNGAIQGGNEGVRYVVMITSDKHDYFVRIPVGVDGSWNTQNTTTPRKFLENFLTPGRIELRISVVEIGRNIPISKISQEVFVVSEALLTRGN